ncbi:MULTISPECIES: chorismate synthase [unclassified Wenzhouxiangella]|uniref:chorismate synthase n=1 Tax=unclassified Wenzhouxiangella TaxID=2613841 RepID=UPI000E32C9C0|nr:MULTISPECIES: chorismate synthase [unclassified Wenzhouxiangella]RFF27623.1 chorismate synthase [Wenzhouxiangella sp. 15181]RFP70147.1 chorismate synthase [Wenzhouxiangella sp. 15190]
MSTNSFGHVLTLTTFGESHGPAIGCVIDGFPPGMEITAEEIRDELMRRATGQSRWTSQRKEAEDVQILSGTFEGRTTGAPIALLIYNTDARSKDYSKIAEQFRPGHADYTYHHKYGIRDYRGGGRSSARETAMRVAAGALARKYLKDQVGVEITGWLGRIGDEVCDEKFDASVIDSNPFFCPDASRIEALENYMKKLWKSGDSVGALVKARATGVPVGLGAPVYAKLDGDLAAAMMSINAAKGVEIGAGFDSVAQKGTEHRDEITPEGFESNHAGGVLGGISTGQTVECAVAFKPTSSLRLPGKTVDIRGEPVEIVTTGRHDPCVGIRAVPIVEAMLALVIMDHYLLNRAQCGDVGEQTPRIPG